MYPVGGILVSGRRSCTTDAVAEEESRNIPAADWTRDGRHVRRNKECKDIDKVDTALISATLLSPASGSPVRSVSVSSVG